MYPCMEINLSKIKYNANHVHKLCENIGVNIWSVTKGVCATPEVARIIVEGGVVGLADSRLKNLIKLKDIPAKKILTRIPMHSEVDDVVEYADYSLNSELTSLELLGQAAYKKGKIHNVIIMIDLGDLREGIWPDEIDEFVEKAANINGICIKGFGVNLTCFGGVLPKESNLKNLVEIAKKMETKYNLELEFISGGNSSSFYLIKEGKLPKGINNLRFGEVILLGREAAFGNLIEGLYNDAFIIKAQIVELKKKPSLPIGEIGRDAFGNVPQFVDKGIMKRAIIAIGKQDIEPSSIHPLDQKIEVIGASSDHTILNITECDKEYKVGDIIEFSIDYVTLLKASTSDYVRKVITE